MAWEPDDRSIATSFFGQLADLCAYENYVDMDMKYRRLWCRTNTKSNQTKPVIVVHIKVLQKYQQKGIKSLSFV